MITLSPYRLTPETSLPRAERPQTARFGQSDTRPQADWKETLQRRWASLLEIAADWRARGLHHLRILKTQYLGIGTDDETFPRKCRDRDHA